MTRARILADYVSSGDELAVTTATADAALARAGGAMTGAVTTNSTFDGRDVAADGVTADAALPKAGGAMTGAITTNSTFDGIDIATRDAVLTSTTTTAGAALPKAGGAMTGAITTNSTFDGIDIATRDAVLTSTTTTANAALPTTTAASTYAPIAGPTFTGTTTVAKIVETGGALKENLITNSGFDVWSNSTFVTSGTDRKDPLLYAMNGMSQSHVSGGEITNATYTGGSSSANPEFRGNIDLDLVIGERYRFQYTIASSGNPSALRMYIQGVMFTSAAVGTFTHYFTATQVNPLTQYLVLKQNTLPATTTTNTSLYLMTPGCVADDTLACDGWYKTSTASIWRQPPQEEDPWVQKDGSYYSMKVTTGATNNVVAWKNTTTRNGLSHVKRFAGRTVTFGAWVYTTSTSHIKLSIDTSSSSESDYHGGGGWEWMELTQAVPAATTMFWCRFNHSLSGITSYISQPMLVFGSSIGSGNYTRPKGEIIWFEKFDDLTSYTGAAISSDATIDLEVQSEGKIPKSVKAVYCNVAGQGAGVDNELVLGQDGPDQRGVWMITSVITPRYMSGCVAYWFLGRC